MSTDKVIFVGEQWRATGSHMTGCDVTGRDHVRNRKYVMRMRNRKFRNTPSGTFSPEVTSVTGNDNDHGHRRGGRVRACHPEVAQYPPSGGIFTGSWLQEVTSFSRAFFLVVVQNVGWGCSIRRSRLALSLVICPFYFHKCI